MINEDSHVFRGMRRDNHQITQDSKFLWDARNIRITNREDNTLFSITNEKGTSEPLLTFEGIYVGHCVLGKYLVVFTSTKDEQYSYIYRIEKDGDAFKTIILFQGNINISSDNPIEAIGYYETDLIQKVYWVDGFNQPRMINIAKPELLLPEYCIIDGVNLQGPVYSTNSRVNNELKGHIPNGLYNTNSFDFIRELSLEESIKVEKIHGQGEFSSGTVQYAFSYFNKYEQESNIFHTTPLYYASPRDRGGNPEEKIACSFKITITNPDHNFDYIRVYSIHRTSIDAIPTVKILEDIFIGKSNELFYTDTNTTGSTIDPSQLLYIGGETLVANCIEQKDNTLFLGNIEQKGGKYFNAISSILTEGYAELNDYSIENSLPAQNNSGVYYDYTPNLYNGYSGVFKYGETYRLGLQVQYKNGKWSEPIYYADEVLNNSPIWDTFPNILSKSLRIFSDPGNYIRQYLYDKDVRKIRACVVFPRTYERDVICQGILCPTVFGVAGRRNNTLYSMSSWFFRPATVAEYNDNTTHNTNNVYNGSYIQYRHNHSLFTGADRGAEIQNMHNGAISLSSIDSGNINKYNSHFFVDENIVTFHSPDIEFDTNIVNSNFDGVSLRIIGMAKLGAIIGDIDIQTSSPTINSISPGFYHSYIGYQTDIKSNVNGGLVAGPFYRDSAVLKDFKYSKLTRGWMAYPWQRSGSLNNDSKRPEDKGARSAVLSKKKISNLKFFNTNKSIPNKSYAISTPQIFNSNELSVLRISPAHLGREVTYLGNVDTLVTSDSSYTLYSGDYFGGIIVPVSNMNDNNYITESSEPVRMKYKSSPHLVFSLGNEPDKIPLLPININMGTGQNSNDFTFPDWQSAGINNLDPDTEGTPGTVDEYLVRFCTTTNDTGPLASDCKIGDIKICNQSTGDSPYSYEFYIIKEQTSGNLGWTLINNSWENYKGKIVKFKSEYTEKSSSDVAPFGTDALDWDEKSNIYIGQEKLFELGDNFTLIEITRSISTASVDVPLVTSTTSDAKTYTLEQLTFDSEDDCPYLLIGELERNVDPNIKFGGKSKEALKQNLWIPAGRAVDINPNKTNSEGNYDIIVPFEYGDTWYSRYDCLKTYPFTQEDENSVVEIGSFMCETRVNIDGRYDRNRGQLSNLNMTPQNFNLLNEVYSQKDNFFNYRVMDDDYYKQHIFNNQITWSKQKNAGEDVDTWANITLANTLDLNGDRGSVTAIRTLNDDLVCFQEKAINQLLFNSREQIPVSDGVPIEIANGRKMSGNRILNDTIGCNNKWSIIRTPSYLYFIDSNTDSIYSFNGKLANISGTNGMTWWLKESNINSIWNPLQSDLNGIRSFYDSKYNDVYFTPGPFNYIEQPDALCYSERLEQFTSLMSYGGTQAMFNFNDSFYSLRDDGITLKLYENNVGKYNDFYGNNKGWSISFISNDKPIYTKIFDTIELRTDHYSPTNNLLNTCPINYIKAENEYQKGEVFNNSLNMRKKFRVWRGLLPRHSNTRQRIRNPWSMITLGWDTKKEESNNKAVIHDVSVKYTL